MAMTREERNKAASNRRFANHHRSFMSFKRQMLDLFDRARKEKLRQADLLEYRSRILTDSSYKLTPGWVQDRLTGVWEVLIDLLQRELTFCYPHPDTGVMTDKRVICDNSELLHRVNTDLGGYYWKNEDGTFTHCWFGRADIKDTKGSEE